MEDTRKKLQGELLFEINGDSERTFMQKLKKQYPYYIAFYSDGIELRLDNNHYIIPQSDVVDIYTIYAVANGKTSNQVKIIFADKESEDGYSNFVQTCSRFPKLDELTEELLRKGWGHLKINEDQTKDWIYAVIAVTRLYTLDNGRVFGKRYKPNYVISDHVERLASAWSVHNKEQVLLTFFSLYDEYDKLTHIDDRRYRAMCAWDLQRVILVSIFAYLADYITLEEGLDWSLKACQKIQQIFNSWDDFMEYYCIGCSDWEEVPLNNPDGIGYARLKIYEQLKRTKNSYWTVPWDTALRKTWR